MSKLGDLIVRLRLQYDDYKKGLKKADADTKGFAGTLGKIKGVGLAVWGAIGGAVVAFAAKMVESTNKVGDAWARFTAQANAAWTTFVQSVSAMRWDNLIGRIREATAAAKELQNALDAEFEVTNSIRIQKAAMAEELNALEILARNASKPYEERAAAAQKYLDMVRPLYEQEMALANSLLDAQQGRWLAGTGLADTKQTRDDLTKFLVDYGKMNNGLADATSQLMNLQKERDVTYKTMLKSGNFTALKGTLDEQDAQIAALNAFLESFASQNGYQTSIAKLAEVYETMRGDADTKPLVDALIRAGEAAGQYDRDTKRMQSALNTSLAQIDGPAGIKVPSIADALEQAAAEMDEVTDSDIADSVKHLEDVLNDIDVTAPSVKMGDVEAPAINTEKLRTSMDVVNEMLADYRARMSEGLESSDAQVIEFAKFKLPDINATDIEQALREVEAIIDNYNEILGSVDGEMSLSIDITGLKEALAEAENLAEGYRNTVDIIRQASYMLEDAIVQSTAGGMQAFTDMLMGLEGADPSDILAALLQPFANTATQLGSMLLAEGLGIKAFKESLKTLNPAIAIGAGTALIALGAALGSSIRALGGSGSSSSGSNGGYDSGGPSAAGQNYESTLTVEVTGKISGSDIVISGNKTNDKWNR